MNRSDGRILSQVVAAFVRSIRAMGYYDDRHPVFEATRREAHNALQSAFHDQAIVTLGGGGHHLLVDEEGTILADPPAVALARRLFDNAVVAIRLRPEVREHDLGLLMRTLAEREDRIRASGGVRAKLERDGVVGIEVVEVDIDALFAGRHAELGPLLAGDPVAELALKAVLRFREEETKGTGDVLHVSLEQVGSPGSLGSFLEDLMDQTEPGVVAGTVGGGSLSSDDFADLASQAFLRSQQQLRRAPGAAVDLAQSADILSNALVRLSPDARFALLRQLAGAEDADEVQEAAARDLGDRLDDRTVTAAIASALVDQQGDPATVRAIGNLIRRIRPVEAERKRLLADVDADLRNVGRPIDGVLWQEMQSRAFSNSSLGLLEMSLHDSRRTLQEYARARRAGQLEEVLGQDVLHTVDAQIIDYWTTHVLVDLLDAPGRLGAGATDACRLQLERLDEAGAGDECVLLVQAMMRRTDREDAKELVGVLMGLLEGPQGSKWSVRLLRHDGPPSQMMGDIILTALDRPGDRAYKKMLIERLTRFDPDSLQRLIKRVALRVTALQAQSLVVASLRSDTAMGVRAARVLLRSSSTRVREVVLKTIVDRPEADVVALLAHVAGWKSDKDTRSLLGLDGSEGRSLVHRMQLTAIGALGFTRSGMAARPLFDILVRSRVFSDQEQDELRVAAALALRTNASAEARQALEEARRHRKRVIRETVERVLGRGGQP